MAYNGVTPSNVFGQGTKDLFNGDASTTAFTLSRAVLLATDIEVFISNVRQEPNVAYTVSGTTLTFTGTPASGTGNIYVVHQSANKGTLVPPTGLALTPSTITASGNATIGGTLGVTGASTFTGTVTANGDMVLGGTTPTLTIGDAGAEDAKIVFDGNAQDFHIGLDDSADDLIIGLGSALGTTPAISIDENLVSTFGGAAVGKTDTDTSNTGTVDLDFRANTNFVLTLTGNITSLTASNEVAGQSGFIVFIQDGTGSRTVSLHGDYETAGGAGITLSSAASATDIVPYVVAASSRILLGVPQLAFS
jgi:fibronectin-binding autotransporter adhesin